MSRDVAADHPKLGAAINGLRGWLRATVMPMTLTAEVEWHGIAQHPDDRGDGGVSAHERGPGRGSGRAVNGRHGIRRK